MLIDPYFRDKACHISHHCYHCWKNKTNVDEFLYYISFDFKTTVTEQIYQAAFSIASYFEGKSLPSRSDEDFTFLFSMRFINLA